MALRCGDVRKGLSMCTELGSRTLMRECAEILEAMKQLSDAAQLYESAQYYDKAAHLYIKLKSWTKVGEDQIKQDWLDITPSSPLLQVPCSPRSRHPRSSCSTPRPRRPTASTRRLSIRTRPPGTTTRRSGSTWTR